MTMPRFSFNRKGEDEQGSELIQSEDLIAVRTRSRESLIRTIGPVFQPVPEELQEGTLVLSYPEAGVEVYRLPTGEGRPSLEQRKLALQELPDVRFAGGVLVDPVTEEPVLYTENLFVKFSDDADPDTCRAVLEQAELVVREEVSYARNAFLVRAYEGTGQRVFDIAQELLGRDDVEYAHPELIRPRGVKAIAPQQWHLKRTNVNGVDIDAHANVEAAHKFTRGGGVTIAVIDDGVEVGHPEFYGPGKLRAARDVTLGIPDARPKYSGEDHGTACAGVACANGQHGASGVAPDAHLMPIRLSSALGSYREAEAFVWAADNGADVISCSWGPIDGEWWRPEDPRHDQMAPIPAHTRLAIEYAAVHGRNGKGCVVLFAAGNGNESVDNDGYASNPNVVAVAACNDTGRRSVYSDFGDALWCAFPSNDVGFSPFGHPPALTPGIWTTDRPGRLGYNPGNVAYGDLTGDFTNRFGGTSSACPGAAGVVALVLAVNPNLMWFDVKEILKRACDRIDQNGGNYDTDGHSQIYGYGRLNALSAVTIARNYGREAGAGEAQ